MLTAPALERRGVRAAFLERGGGVSEAPFASLNLGFRTGDGPDHVRHNRGLAVSALEAPRFAVARQAHGTGLVRVPEEAAGAGFDDPDDALGPADILATSASGVPVAVLVADCLPIVLGSDDLLVAAHAGWRGLAGGVITRAAAEFEDRAGVTAWIGPAIGPCHYDVGPDVVTAVERGSGGGAVMQRRGGMRALDLRATAARALQAAGIRDLEVTELCTACAPERFYSHRRDGRTGRHAMVAMRA